MAVANQRSAFLLGLWIWHDVTVQKGQQGVELPQSNLKRLDHSGTIKASKAEVTLCVARYCQVFQHWERNSRVRIHIASRQGIEHVAARV